MAWAWFRDWLGNMGREESRLPRGGRHIEETYHHIDLNIHLEGLAVLTEGLALLRQIAARMDQVTQVTERLEGQMVDLQGQLQTIGQQLDEVTTSLGTTVQTGVDRILAEIARQGTVTPEVQAAADHISNAAQGLIALTVQALARFQKTGIPDVPPAPQPIPPVEPLPEPLPGGGEGEGGGAQPMSRRR